MTKKQAYLKLAKRYCGAEQLEFVCIDLKKLSGIPLQNPLNLDNYLELMLFKAEDSSAWLSPSNLTDTECMEIKVLVLLFAIEILNDEEKIQKKSKVRSLR